MAVAVFDPAFHRFLSWPLAAVAVVAGARGPRTWQAVLGIALGCLVAVASLVELLR